MTPPPSHVVVPPRRPGRSPRGSVPPRPRPSRAARTLPTLAGLLCAVVLLLTATVGPAPLTAQETDGADGLRVFLECSGMGCDTREFRTEINWVNWMRDRRDSQVHVIVTTQGTGSGGQLYTLDFIGVENLDGFSDELTFSTLGTDVRDEAVRGLTRVLAVGLGRFSVLAGAGTPFDIVGTESDAPTDRLVTSDQVEDPWDFWVFEVDANGNMNGETSRKNRRLGGGFEARRTTTTWKLEFEAGGSWRRNDIVLSDSTITDSRRDWDTEFLAVYALADHWSVGGGAEASAATRTNQDLSVRVGPTLEYSLWPYDESPRRSLRVRYNVGMNYFDYEEETLFGQTSETRPVESLEVFLNQRQPWGSIFANVEGSHYLHDLGKYRVRTGGFLSFRVLRGLSFRVNGSVEWIRDQLFLSADDVSDDEILLERRRLASNFDWDVGVGFSFQFGSIFNNVVNNRF